MNRDNRNRSRSAARPRGERGYGALAVGLALALLPACQSVTITTPDGYTIRSINTGDLGNIPSQDATSSQGGITSLVAGSANTGRSSAFAETEPGYIRATAPNGTTVEIGGVINNSTTVARHWDGITSSIRNWVARLVAKDLFDAVNTKTNQAEQTARAKSGDDAAVKINQSDNALKATESNNAVRTAELIEP